MPKKITSWLPDDVPADGEAVARVEGTSVNKTAAWALIANDRRRQDPAFRSSLRRIAQEDQELLDRLAK